MKSYFFPLLAMMLFSVAGMAQTNTSPRVLTVAQDGSGNYKTIQSAIDAVRAYSPERITINIKNGVYREKVVVPAWVTNVSFVGESKEGTIIVNGDYSGKFMNADTLADKTKFSTFNSYTMYIHGNDISIKNITISNNAGRVGQAVALHVDGDRFEMENCSLLGNQDTLLTANDTARQYFVNCYIEGTTDFIFGNATAVFQNCTLKSLVESFVTAASTSQQQQFGYVFQHCKLVADASVKRTYLGRPWRAYAKVVFMDCEMDSSIRPEGWHNWGKVENEATAFYAEYNNTGAGANTDKRVAWSHVLTESQAKQYTIENIFKGWKPAFGQANITAR